MTENKMNNNLALQNLALQFRPQCFGDVVGQAQTIAQIVNAVKNIRANPNQIQMGMLLTGVKGTGKTTTARLIAKFINCLKDTPDINKPCECDNCARITSGDFSSYTEIDGATYGGVDKIKTTVSNIVNTPTMHSVRVLVIDEVHRLSPAAASALLKIVEEPPERLLFVFATTEPQKVMDTIKSRVKEYGFGLIAKDTIQARLAFILETIGNIALTADKPGYDAILELITNASRGSMRDAIKLLSGVLELETVTLDSVKSFIGFGDYKQVGELLACCAGDVAKAFVLVAKMEKEGKEPKSVLEMLQTMLSDLYLVASGCGVTTVYDTDYYKKMFSFGLEEINNIVDTVDSVEKIGSTKWLSIQRIVSGVFVSAAANGRMQTKVPNKYGQPPDGSLLNLRTGETRAVKEEYANDNVISDKITQMAKATPEWEPTQVHESLSELPQATQPDPFPKEKPKAVLFTEQKQPEAQPEEEPTKPLTNTLDIMMAKILPMPQSQAISPAVLPAKPASPPPVEYNLDEW